MKKNELKNLLSASGRNDCVIANFTYKGKNVPCIELAGMMPLYLNFVIELMMMKPDEVFAIGRGQFCDYRTPAGIVKISRLHCYIEKVAFEDGEVLYRIHDVSKYGTTVREQQKKKSFMENVRSIFASL